MSLTVEEVEKAISKVHRGFDHLQYLQPLGNGVTVGDVFILVHAAESRRTLVEALEEIRSGAEKNSGWWARKRAIAALEGRHGQD